MLAVVLLLNAGCADDGARPVEPATTTPAPAPVQGSPVAEVVFRRSDLDVARPLSPGAVHRYELDLAGGRFVHLVVEQRELDVYLRWTGPTGREVVVDSPTGTSGAEHLYLVVDDAGGHTLSVHAFPESGRPGAYLVRIAEEGPPDARDRLRATAEATFAAAYVGASGLVDAPTPEVTAGYETAARLFRRLGDRRRQADALHLLGNHQRRGHRYRDAARTYRRLLGLLSGDGHRRQRGIVHNDLALAYRRLGDLPRERRHLERALQLLRTVGDRRNEAVVLHGLGRLQQRLGRPVEALGLLQEAAGIQERAGLPRDLVDIHNAMGDVYRSMGEVALALDHQRRALSLLDPQAQAALRADTLGFIARTHLVAGDLTAAADAYREVLDLADRLDDDSDRALAWTGLGQVAELRGRPDEALHMYRRSLAVWERLEIVAYQAILLGNLAAVHLRLGAAERALALYDRALELAERIQHRQQMAASHLGRARALRALGRTADALESAGTALAAVEDVFGVAPVEETGGLDLPFYASRQEYFDLVVQLLMQRHHAAPEAGYDSLALATAEQAQARNFLRLLGRAPPSRSPAGASGRRAVVGIQELLGTDSALLEIHLGDEASYLWLLDHRGLVSHTLPPRQHVETLAVRAHDLLQKSDRVTHSVPAERAMEALARVLLAPVAGRLEVRRLLVVTGGALELVPFPALPVPTGDGAPSGFTGELLLERHRVVHVPSASVLAALRSRSTARRDTGPLLAVLADPVFSPGDSRLAGKAVDAAAEVRGVGGSSLQRLRHTRREAEAILAAAAGADGVLSALDFDARRELVTGGALRDHRILHFATHGLLHPVHPGLSALLFSRFDAAGRPRHGRLALHDVHELRLEAELVVLSACRTALGKEVRGEGILGLPRGFLRAGASRVLVSLWSVQDESTAELMARFYHHLLVERVGAAEALRRAQLSMRREARYAPYHWAGFVLQGLPD